MNNTATPENVIELPGRHSVDSTAFQLLVIALAVTELGIIAAVMRGWFWLVVPLALVASHFMHGVLVGFHEASHGLLRRNRRFNEFDGVLTGLFSFTSFSLYRAAHQTHHAFLATERDEELWPFVDTTKPRWARRLFAFLELNLGLLFTPFLFLRTFFRRGSPIRNRKVRRRIWAEIIMIVVVWTSVLWAVTHWQVWTYFLWMYVVPGVLAANMQSWRKYIEHVGLTGGTVNGATRNIVSQTPLGRFLAYTLLHEPYHGVHHLHSGIPHDALPRFLPELDPTRPDEQPLYPSYWSAVKHLVRNLADPRVGAQWNNDPFQS
jgi:fatty acid desaturase